MQQQYPLAFWETPTVYINRAFNDSMSDGFLFFGKKHMMVDLVLRKLLDLEKISSDENTDFENTSNIQKDVCSTLTSFIGRTFGKSHPVRTKQTFLHVFGGYALHEGFH